MRLLFQVTRKVKHYFLIYNEISELLFQISNASYFFFNGVAQYRNALFLITFPNTGCKHLVHVLKPCF